MEKEIYENALLLWLAPLDYEAFPNLWEQFKIGNV